MPQVVQLPYAAPTALGNLGSVLMGASADYAQTARSERERERARNERLADIADERAYQTSQRQTIRGERLADIDAEQERAVKRELVRLGLLAPDKLNAPLNDPAVAAAVEQMRRNGLLQQYQDAFKTGDLTVADLGDEAKVAEGLAKYSARLGGRTRLQEDNAGRAQQRISQLVTEEQALSQQAAQLNAQLNAPQPEPSMDQVRNLATQMARAQSGGRAVGNNEINAMLEPAAEQLRSQLLQKWAMDRQDATIQRQILASRLADIRAEENTLTSRFGVVGLADPAATPVSAPPAAPRVDPAAARRAATQQMIEAIRVQMGAQSSAALNAGALPNPTNEPLIAAENQRVAGQNWQTQLADPFNAKVERLQTVNRQISLLQSSPQAVDAMTGEIETSAGRAQELSRLSQEKIRLESEIKNERPNVFFQGVTPPGTSLQRPVAPPSSGLYDLAP
jgi:hypothetical protein